MAVREGQPTGRRALAVYGNVAVFAVCVMVTAFSVTTLFHRDAWRARIDATKTRAYSLSEQTRQMLSSLEGSWQLVVMMVEAEADRTVRRQVDEVLDRFAAAAPNLSVARIDPTDPTALDEFEGVLERLRQAYAQEIANYDRDLARARQGFLAWLTFVESESAVIRDFHSRLPASLPIREQIGRIQPYFSLMASDGTKILTSVDSAMSVSETQPLPDYETARSILAAALLESAQRIGELARIMAALRTVPSVDRDLAIQADNARTRYESMARQLAQAGDPLRHLPPLEISRIGRQMQQGETAIVIGPPGASVIPSAQLFPKMNMRSSGSGSVSFDQRFRGEQVIASSVRSLLVPHLPKVVFVHAMGASLLQRSDDGIDLFGVKSLLEGARLEVVEWIVGRDDRPIAEPGQPIVWVLVPSVRASPEVSPVETILLNTMDQLLSEGEPVLLSFFPSIMHSVRQPDPWQRLVRPWGLEVDTSRSIYESILEAGGQRVQRRQQGLDSFRADHPIGRAVNGLQTTFGFAVPVRVAADQEVSSIKHFVLAEVGPSPYRWLEPNWASRTDVPQPEAGDERLFSEPIPIVVAAERPHPQRSSGEQRLMVVGSGDWMQSRLADVATTIGGNRMALVSPGNIELLQSSIYWLAQLDELIAQSPTGQQVARLEGVTQSHRLRWGVILILVLPLASLVAGGAVFLIRRI